MDDPRVGFKGDFSWDMGKLDPSLIFAALSGEVGEWLKPTVC